MKKLLGVALLGVVVAGDAGAAPPPPPPPPPPSGFDLSSPSLGQFLWTNQCTIDGQFVLGQEIAGSTCMSARTTLFSNGWLQVELWNRSGFNGLNDEANLTGFALQGAPDPYGDSGVHWYAPTGWELDNIAGYGNIVGFGYATKSGANQGLVSEYSSVTANRIVTPWNGFDGAGSTPALFRYFVGSGNSWYTAGNLFVSGKVQSTVDPNSNATSTFYWCASDGQTFQACSPPPCIPGVNCEEPDPCVTNPTAPGCGGGPQETVPEPATMTLLATGLAGLAAAKRRRQNGKGSSKDASSNTPGSLT